MSIVTSGTYYSTVKNKHKNSCYLNAKFVIMVLVQIISINNIGKFTCCLE